MREVHNPTDKAVAAHVKSNPNVQGLTLDKIYYLKPGESVFETMSKGTR